MAPRVLIVEDEQDLASVMSYNLRADGFETARVDTVAGARHELGARRYDLVVLDLMLPDGSGLDVCRWIRAQGPLRDLPVLIASARSEEVDRIVGLELGAAYYLVKPFAVRELVLRVRSILRRTEPPPSREDLVEFGVLRVDRGAHRVFVEDQEVHLTTLEFRLLTTLLERRNRTQSRDMLLVDVWQLSARLDSRTVDTHVKRLREKLGAAAGYIRTVRGIGYRFVGSPDEPESN